MADDDVPQLTLDLANSKTSMRLAFVSKGKVDAGVVMNASQFDNVMAAMIELRAQMEPPVPTTFPIDKPSHGIQGTHYHFGFDPASQQIKLSIRNSGLGWMSFAFDADKFQILLDQAKLSKP